MGKLILVLALLAVCFTGCNDEVKPSQGVPSVVSSGEERTEVVISGENVLENDFKLLNFMTDEENYMISPFSLRMAMMLAANGAEGATQKEILDAFAIEDIEAFNDKAKELIAKYNQTKSVKLNVANSIWLNLDRANGKVKFHDDYKRVIETDYDGVAKAYGSKEIAKRANEWIEEKTNKKIKNVLDESKPAEFLSVLINTIYFKGEWAEQFKEYNTYKETFTSRDGAKSEIDFMHQTEKLDYYEDKYMKMVRVPYQGNDLAMYFVLPEQESKMDIASALGKMKNWKVNLSIPKFKTEYSLSFKEILKEIGVGKAFDDSLAEFKNKMFTGVAEDVNVYIDDVLQKTFIEVDENGTEAAAATAVIMFDNCAIMPEEEKTKEFKADKPFIYFIMDENTKEVLFMGEYAYAKE